MLSHIVTIFKINLKIKTIYKLQLIQNKKTNIIYLQDTKSKTNSSDPLHELLQLQICKCNALLHLKTTQRNVQMRNVAWPNPNFNKQGCACTPVYLIGSWHGGSVCSSLAEQLCACTSITARAFLQVHVADGLIATFEVINFVHLP